MKLRRSLSEPEAPIELNLIPLIDVIMFLLIFFISTTSFMDMRGISVDKPQSAGSARNKNDTILLTVTGNGRIFYGHQEISLDGVKPTVKRLCATEPLPVVIQAEENSRSGIVVRVIDEALMGGAKDVSLASQKG
ncbi:MAG TPA: biopolymer transporter ExbD [Haliangiales bacterium]|nr:biopolymer transporter ExbD [Haliangiales bacterium]